MIRTELPSSRGVIYTPDGKSWKRACKFSINLRRVIQLGAIHGHFILLRRKCKCCLLCMDSYTSIQNGTKLHRRIGCLTHLNAPAIPHNSSRIEWVIHNSKSPRPPVGPFNLVLAHRSRTALLRKQNAPTTCLYSNKCCKTPGSKAPQKCSRKVIENTVKAKHTGGCHLKR